MEIYLATKELCGKTMYFPEGLMGMKYVLPIIAGSPPQVSITSSEVDSWMQSYFNCGLKHKSILTNFLYGRTILPEVKEVSLENSVETELKKILTEIIKTPELFKKDGSKIYEITGTLKLLNEYETLFDSLFEKAKVV